MLIRHSYTFLADLGSGAVLGIMLMRNQDKCWSMNLRELSCGSGNLSMQAARMPRLRKSPSLGQPISGWSPLVWASPPQVTATLPQIECRHIGSGKVNPDT